MAAPAELPRVRIASGSARVDRLVQEADRAHAAGPLGVAAGGDEVDRDVARGAVGLEALHDAPAVHVGQADVEDDAEGAKADRQVEAVVPARWRPGRGSRPAG